MTFEQFTKAQLVRLVRDVERDRRALSRHVDESQSWQRRVDDGENGSCLAALALAIHHYYTALENILARTLRAIEGDVPQGADWHLRLLEEAAQPLPSVRPALLSEQLLPDLNELRRFRHFIRNAYSVDLDAGQMVRLAGKLAGIHPLVDRDVSGLLSFLQAILDGLAGGK